MKTVSRAEGDQLWSQYWDTLRREWFKVEVLQDYSAEDKSESLDAWMAGDKARSLELLRLDDASWTQASRDKAKRGVKLTRIHVVDYPLSEYVQWEIEAYKIRNIPLAQESVYLVDRASLSGIDLPTGDFMMFDQQKVVLNTYDEAGYAFQQTFYDEQDQIEQFLKLRAVLQNANLQPL